MSIGLFTGVDGFPASLMYPLPLPRASRLGTPTGGDPAQDIKASAFIHMKEKPYYL